MQGNDMSLDYAASLSAHGKRAPKGCYKCRQYNDCSWKFTGMNCALDEAVLRMSENSSTNGERGGGTV